MLPTSVTLRARQLAVCPQEIHTPGLHYTAYVMWERLPDHEGEFELADMNNGVLSDLVAAVRDRIKHYYGARDEARRNETIAAWVEAGSYPYEAEPTTELERVERETFRSFSRQARPSARFESPHRVREQRCRQQPDGLWRRLQHHELPADRRHRSNAVAPQQHRRRR